MGKKHRGQGSSNPQENGKPESESRKIIKESSAGPATPEKSPITKKIRQILAALLLTGAVIEAGNLMIKNKMKPLTGQENIALVDSERMPEDPRGRYVLDDSWREYAKKEGTTLKVVSERLFPLLHKANDILETIYPPLPQQTRLNIRWMSNGIYKGKVSAAYVEEDPVYVCIENGAPRVVYVSNIETKHELWLPDLKDESLDNTLHELAHEYNAEAGLQSLNMIDEGLATFLEYKYNPTIGRGINHDELIEKMLQVFPELSNLPLHTMVITGENIGDWIDTLGKLRFLGGMKIMKEWTDLHPDFLQTWLLKLTQKNQKKVAAMHESLSTLEILQTGEEVSAGFINFMDQHPSTHEFSRVPKVTYYTRVIEDKLFTVNIRSGTRVIPVGNYTVETGDILAPLERNFDLLDEKMEKIGTASIGGGMNITPINILQELVYKSSGERKKIAFIGYADSDGKIVRLEVP